MTTINSVGNALTGTTGTGLFVGSNSPSLVTPTFNAATTDTLTFSPTNNGLVGTTTNDSAVLGIVGEYIDANVNSAFAITLTTATPTNLCTLSLTAGDWDVWGTAFFTQTGSPNAIIIVSINNFSASLTDASYSGVSYQAVLQNTSLTPAQRRMSINGTTSIYLVTQATFITGSVFVCGFMAARRVR